MKEEIYTSVQAEIQSLVDPLFGLHLMIESLGPFLEARRLKRNELLQAVEKISEAITDVRKKHAMLIQRLERRQPSYERESLTHKFSIGGHEGYVTVGRFEDGSPAQIFITMAKEGSTIAGLMDSFATMTSLALQYGVPLEVMVDKLTHTRFEPSGFTKNPEIPMARSIMDYIFKWMARKFLSSEEQIYAGVILRDDSPTAAATATQSGKKRSPLLHQQDSPSCSGCGSIMVRSGMCYKCLNCGATAGCS